MIAAAEKRGYQYYAVTDHAPNLVMQRMTSEKMLAQREQLRALQDTANLKLLHGSELNIAADGSVDWDEDFLRGFDLCVASVQTEAPVPKQCIGRPASRPTMGVGARAVGPGNP
jgi:DNA polymerase (family X)